MNSATILIAIILLVGIVIFIKAKILRRLVTLALIAAILFGGAKFLKNTLDIDLFSIFDKDDDGEDEGKNEKEEEEKGDIENGIYEVNHDGLVMTAEVKGDRMTTKIGDVETVSTYSVDGDTAVFVASDGTRQEFSYEKISGGFKLGGLTYTKK